MTLLETRPDPRLSVHASGALGADPPHFGVRTGRHALGWGDRSPASVASGEAALQSAERLARQAGNALDAFGHACITLRASDGRMLWQTPLARDLLATWYPEDTARRPLHAPQPVIDWLQRHLADAVRQLEPPRLSLADGARRLTFRLHRRTDDEDEGEGAGGEWLVVMREESDTSVIEAMGAALGLTAREAQVLYWVVKGKINRDIADIVGASPATVKKHLEHVYAKLGVETRTAAAAMAMDRIRQWQPSFPG